MKAIKLTAIAGAVLLSTSAMANVVTDTANTVATGTVNAVKATSSAIVDGGRTFLQTATKPAAVSAEVGTLGYGANITWDANDSTAVVAGWTGGDVTDLVGDDFSARGVDYTVETDLSNPYLGVQLRPMKNWLTVNTGIIIPDNDVKVTAQANGGTYKIDDVVYNAADVGSLTGTLEHRNKVAPYLTAGFRPTINNNWGVFGEIGAAYMGETKATITSDKSGSVTSADGATTTDIAALTEQAEHEIEDKGYAKWAPIAKVGVTYRF